MKYAVIAQRLILKDQWPRPTSGFITAYAECILTAILQKTLY